MEKKYELVNYNKETNLWRIRALRSFNDVKAGDHGGWIKKESNLSHDGNCWIYGNAMIYGNAIVYGNAKVCGNAKVYGDAKVFGNAKVFDDAVVAEHNHVQYSKLDCDITDGKNKNQSIQCQTNLPIINNEVYCCKVVRNNLTSLYDHTFQYKVGEWISVADYNDYPTISCAGGLHFSHLSYWENNGGEKIIYCKVPLEDVIAVQQGKIRTKRAFVIGVCDNKVY